MSETNEVRSYRDLPGKRFFTTGTGRIVEGSVHEWKTTDQQGNQLTHKKGEKLGQPKKELYFAVAIPKNDPSINKIWQEVVGAAKDSFPHFFDQNGNCLHPKFAYKIVDGDSTIPNENLKKPCDKEGFRGCWVIRMKTEYAVKCHANNADRTAIDPATIKRGDYVQVHCSVVGNDDKLRPGVFINPFVLLFIGYGEEISTGPSATEAFGTTVVDLPPGASAFPTTSSTMPSTGVMQTVGMPAATMPGGTAIQQTATGMPAGLPAGTGVPPMGAGLPPMGAGIPPMGAGTGVQPSTIPSAYSANMGTSQPVIPNPQILQPPASLRFMTQHGVFSLEQLRAVGYTDAMIATLPQVQ